MVLLNINKLNYKIMNLSTYEFPKLNKVDFAFSTLDTDKVLLEEAKKRNPKKGIEKFQEIFYNGGKIELKKDVEGTWKEKAFVYAKCLMKSWSPKHEHKELVVGMIFEECLVL
jgi:hypothetical protein